MVSHDHERVTKCIAILENKLSEKIHNTFNAITLDFLVVENNLEFFQTGHILRLDFWTFATPRPLGHHNIFSASFALLGNANCDQLSNHWPNIYTIVFIIRNFSLVVHFLNFLSWTFESGQPNLLDFYWNMVFWTFIEALQVNLSSKGIAFFSCKCRTFVVFSVDDPIP